MYTNYMSNQPMEEAKAKAFWRDLMGTLWHNPECKSTHGTMSAALVAEHMNISEEKANEFLWSCVRYGITDRQNGGFVA